MQSKFIILAFALALGGCSGQKHELPAVPHMANVDCGHAKVKKTTVQYTAAGYYKIEVLCDDGQHYAEFVRASDAAK